MSDNTNGTLITIEGIDGAGKGTVCRAIQSECPNAVFTTEPDDSTPFGKAVRTALKSDSETPPLAVFCALLADHANHLRTVVEPALNDGKIVVSDRYIDSRFAYQSHALDGLIADPDKWLADLREYLEHTSFPEITVSEEIADAPADAKLFAFLARALNGGDDGLHPALQSGTVTLNIQSELSSEDSPLVDVARDPYGWFGTARGYDTPLPWIRSRQAYEGWSRYPDQTILLDIPVDVSFERKSGDVKERFEKREFLTAVRSNYSTLQSEFADRFTEVTATQSPEHVCADCLETIRPYTEGKTAAHQ